VTYTTLVQYLRMNAAHVSIENITPAKREVCLTAGCTIKVERFSKLSVDTEGSFYSPAFTLCGHKWCLELIPPVRVSSSEGLSTDADYLGVYLINESSEVICMKYDISLANWAKAKIARSDNKPGCGRGKRRFVSGEDLYSKEQQLTNNDAVTFEIEITIFENSTSPLSLCGYTRDLLLSKEALGRDVRLKFKDARDSLWGHKAVLSAYSPVLKSMIEADRSDSEGLVMIKVNDIEPSTMKELLQYMYTDSFSDSKLLQDWDWTSRMFVASCIYDVVSVRTECEAALCEQLSVTNVYSLLSTADSVASNSFDAKELKRKCVDFALVKCPEIFLRALYSDTAQGNMSANTDSSSGGKTKKQKTASV
jgi:hypothetical protein